MATAPYAQRLQLLREVAGTKVYDEKKQESEAILTETGRRKWGNHFQEENIYFCIYIEERRKKIADLLKAIEERLLSLETEKEELKQYQKWDRSKRGLECAICTSECEDAKKRIDEVRIWIFQKNLRICSRARRVPIPKFRFDRPLLGILSESLLVIDTDKRGKECCIFEAIIEKKRVLLRFQI